MKYLRRLVWYIATRLLVFTCVLGLATIAFYFSMNAANIYIILKDGMAQRAMTVMMDADPQLLKNYFSSSYIERDNMLASIRNDANPYARYQVTGIDHRCTWSGCGAGPGDTAQATFVETIPAIDGRILSEYREITPKEQLAVPRWDSARYDVVLTRENGQWHIKNMIYKGAYQTD